MRALALALAALAAPAGAAGDLVVRGGVVHVVSGPSIQDGVVVIRGGKIVAVGPAASVAIPPGLPSLDAAVVTPGLVDAHSVVGLSGHLNQSHDQDQLDKTNAVQPELRAIDSYDARELLIEWVRGFGVTTIHSGHAPGALVSGQTLVAKTRGDTVEEAAIVPVAMVAATLGEGALDEDDKKKTPGTRSKLVAVLRQELVKAKEYGRKRAHEDLEKRPDPDLKLETLGRVLSGELPLLVTAQRHADIASALRVAREFDIRIVLDGAAEAYLLLDEIRAAGVTVIVHPTMARASGETENLSVETAAALADAGIPIALQSGYEEYVPKTRVVLFEAAIASVNGLGFDRALAAVTRDAALAIGVADRVGTIEVGKDGDLALYDGDPFEYATHCVGVVIEGDVVSSEPR